SVDSTDDPQRRELALLSSRWLTPLLDQPALTKLSKTFFRPACSKSISSLLPSIAAMVPYPNLPWNTRWPSDRSVRPGLPRLTADALASITRCGSELKRPSRLARCQPGPRVLAR